MAESLKQETPAYFLNISSTPASVELNHKISVLYPDEIELKD